MHQNLFQDPESIFHQIFYIISFPAYLHDDQHYTAKVDGGLQGGHCLGVSQPIQTAFIHIQEQVTFL